MAQGPLVTEMIEAGAKLAADFDAQYKPISAAFWLKEDEEEKWYLWLTSDQIDSDSRYDAYGEVRRLLNPFPHPWINDMQIRVYGADNPVAKAVIDLMHDYPAQMPHRTGARMLGGRFIYDAYIYAPFVAVA